MDQTLHLNFSTGNSGQSSCYGHDHSLNEWTLFANLKTARYFHATSLLNGDLWMTGGFYGLTQVKLKLLRFLFHKLAFS